MVCRCERNCLEHTMRTMKIKRPCYTVQFFVQLHLSRNDDLCGVAVARWGVLHAGTRLCIFSIKASRLDDAHAFAVVVMETLRDKLLKGCNTMQRWNKLLQSLQKVEPNSTLCNDWCNLSRNDFDHCTACYTVQFFMQLVLKSKIKSWSNVFTQQWTDANDRK